MTKDTHLRLLRVSNLSSTYKERFLLSYTNDELKKMLDQAVVKIQTGKETAAQEEGSSAPISDGPATVSPSSQPPPQYIPKNPGAGRWIAPTIAKKAPLAKRGNFVNTGAASSQGKAGFTAQSPVGKESPPMPREATLDVGPEDFTIKFDFDAAYKDVPEENPLRFRREKRTGCVGGVLYAVFVICISVVLASIAWLAATDVLGFGAEDEQVNVTVSRGFTIEDVIDTLYDAGLIKYKALFRIYADFSSAEEKINPGSYVLNKNYDYRALVHGMTARGGILVETTVTIPEGYTLAEIFTRLEDYGVCTASDLWETATNYDFNYSFLDESTLGERHRLEGFLFPDTYNFYLDSSPVRVINRLLGEFERRFTETYIERAEFMGYTIDEIIIIASMIEREAGSDDERSRIAAVIYNRLNSRDFPFLQIDATLRYAAAGTDRRPTTDVDSPYNTYTNEGLPPGPIANPGIESIHAALYPDSTNEYYYALHKNGTHEFFRTLAQHEAFVASDDFGGERE